jgi:hypothetical protein
MQKVDLKDRWEESMIINRSTRDGMKRLVSSKNEERLAKNYRILNVGAIGLDESGAWTVSSVRIAFSGPLKSVSVAINYFNVDWKDVASDFKAAGLDFYSFFEGGGIQKPLEASQELEEGRE